MRPLIIGSFAGDGLAPRELTHLRSDPLVAKAHCISNFILGHKPTKAPAQINFGLGFRPLLGDNICRLFDLDRHRVVLRRATGNIPRPDSANSARNVRVQRTPASVCYRTDSALTLFPQFTNSVEGGVVGRPIMIDSFARGAASPLSRVIPLRLGTSLRAILSVSWLLTRLWSLVARKWNGSRVSRSVLEHSEIVGSVRRVVHGAPPLGQLGRSRGVARQGRTELA
nr:hypothetical protein [Methylobacterium sp. Leaf122]